MGLYVMVTSLHVFHVVAQKSLVELLHRMGVLRGVVSTVYSSPEYGLHFAQRIDLAIDAHDASVMSIAVNSAWIAESSMALQQVDPL
jgi:hypothetical protein